MRRRRECSGCGERFTTYEYVEDRPLQVLKRTGNAQAFDRDKLRASLAIACAKRPVSPAEVEAIVDRIEDTLSRSARLEILSAEIGEIVMDELKLADRVAYVRYASVYRNFQDIDEFQTMVEELNDRERQEFQSRFQSELPL